MTDEEINLLEIGKRITERRKKLGMTQEMLAEKGDLTPQFVSYAESGKSAFSWSWIYFFIVLSFKPTVET